VPLATGRHQHPKVATGKGEQRLADMPGPYRHAPPSTVAELPGIFHHLN
jgi:hypothetical protein